MEDEPDPGRKSGWHPELASTPLLLALLVSASSPLGLLLLTGSCFLLAFLFAVFENALQYYSNVRLAALAKKRGIDEALDVVLLEEDDILFASKVGRGLFQAVGIALVVVAVVDAAPGDLAAILWAVLLGAFFLLVMVSAPYVIGRRLGNQVLLRWLLPYSRVMRLLRPLSKLLARLVGRMVGNVNGIDPKEEIADEILSAVEEGTREGSIEEDEKRMIEGVIDLREVTADHVMTPRTELVCLPVDTTAEEAVERASGRGLSRMPVYGAMPDDILGVLYVKDLLPFIGKDAPPAINKLLRKPFFVPQSKSLLDLLREMRARQVHLAIVLDEYGGTAGVVTIEDILEEIVGEIVDEHESSAPIEVVRIDENAATVEGKTHIDDLNRSLDLDVPESEEYETVGGLLFSEMGRVPEVGEHYDLNRIRFTILEADGRRINRVRVAVRER